MFDFAGRRICLYLILDRPRKYAAKLNGVVFGRPIIEVPEIFKQVIKEWKPGKISAEEATLRCGMSIATFYRRLRESKVK